MKKFGFISVKDKLFTKDWFVTYTNLVVGSFFMALSFSFFMNPYKIVPGGIYGISIMLHHKFGFPVGLAALCFNLPLTLIGIKVLGSHFGGKTFVSFILTALFADGLVWIFGPDPFNLQNEMILASLFGGLILGVGVGLIFRSKASNGGTDVLASILSKYTNISRGLQLIFIDSAIVIFGLLVFQDWKIPLYAWLTIFIEGKVADLIIRGFSDQKIVYVISDKIDEIRSANNYELKPSDNFFNAQGVSVKEKKEVFFTIVNRKGIHDFEKYIYNIDPDAFIAIVNAQEIYGIGFKSLRDEVS